MSSEKRDLEKLDHTIERKTGGLGDQPRSDAQAPAADAASELSSTPALIDFLIFPYSQANSLRGTGKRSVSRNRWLPLNKLSAESVR
jgi:hypothetical protein